MDKHTVTAILDAMGIDTRRAKAGRDGKYLYILCPLHDDADPSFSITLSGGGPWRCFGCASKGPTMLKLIEEYERQTGTTQTRARELWKADLEPWLKAHGVRSREDPQEEAKPKDVAEEIAGRVAALSWQEREKHDDRLLYEYPLMPEMEYRHLARTTPRYFVEKRGLEKRTCDYWDLGDDPQMQRALIPIRDFKGNLVGVQGRSYSKTCRCHLPFDRWPDDPRAKKSKTGKVKYCPSCGRMRPMKYLTTKGFDKSLFLFGEHMLDRGRKEGIVVESPLSVLWLWQHGYPNAVATMGSIPSEHQFRKLRAWFYDIFLFADGDPVLRPGHPPAGRRWGLEIAGAVGRYVNRVRGRVCPLGKDPADMPSEYLEETLGPPPGVRDDIRTRSVEDPGRQQGMAYYL